MLLYEMWHWTCSDLTSSFLLLDNNLALASRVEKTVCSASPIVFLSLALRHFNGMFQSVPMVWPVFRLRWQQRLLAIVIFLRIELMSSNQRGKILAISSSSTTTSPILGSARPWITGNYIDTYVHSKYFSSIELAQQSYRLPIGYRLTTTWLTLGYHWLPLGYHWLPLNYHSATTWLPLSYDLTTTK